MNAGLEIGGYIIGKTIGVGGMGTVYQALKPGAEDFVALKILLPEYAHDPDYRERFDREVLAMTALNHPNIVPIYEYGEDRGLLYFVMRLIDGPSLASWLETQPFSPLQAWYLLKPVAAAIDYAHQKNIIHRDIKPANILIEPRGKPPNRRIHPYLVDFGLSKLLDLPPLTRQGTQVGTPYYMSPEQIMDEELTTRSDVYALGVVMYEVLSGRRPFEGETVEVIAARHIDAQPPLLSSFSAAFPEPIERVILHAITKSPAERYATPGDFADDYFVALQQIGKEAAAMFYWPQR